MENNSNLKKNSTKNKSKRREEKENEQSSSPDVAVISVLDDFHAVKIILKITVNN